MKSSHNFLFNHLGMPTLQNSTQYSNANFLIYSMSKLLYDWRFTANQFVLAPRRLRPTTRDFFFQLNSCGNSPYVTSSLTRRSNLLLATDSRYIDLEQTYRKHMSRVRMLGADHIENTSSSIVAKACLPSNRSPVFACTCVAGMRLTSRCLAMGNLHLYRRVLSSDISQPPN
jgi:hypothetical protein